MNAMRDRNTAVRAGLVRGGALVLALHAGGGAAGMGLGGWLSGGAAWGQVISDPAVTVETVVTGLANPTCMTFIGADDFLICEKDTGLVKRVQGGVVTGTALDLKVNFFDERGLLGIAAHPDFAGNGFVYIYYSTTSGTTDSGVAVDWVENRVSRFTWDGSALLAGSEVVIVSFPRDGSQANGANHDGGVIAFGPDGKLYGVTGDLNRGRFDNPRIEQNTSATAVAGVGNVFRLNDDGTVPGDNPFAGHADPAIQRAWCYGVRNSFGFDFDSWSDPQRLWITENGPVSWDEINLAYAGFNSGWLKIMGPDFRNARYAENNNTNYAAADLTYLSGATYSDPEYNFLTPIGITALLFVNSGAMPCTWRGKVLFGDTGFRELHLMELNAARDAFSLSGAIADKVADNATERQLTRVGTNFIVTTDLKIGPDGMVYVSLLGQGKVVRLRATTPACRPDYNADCSFDAFDYDDFVSDFFGGHPRADYNMDGVVDAFDYDDFVNDFFTGC